MNDKIVAYKGFDPNFYCMGFHYELGKKYIYDGKIEICKKGYHAVKNPIDVLNYRSHLNTEYAIVECSGEIEYSKDDTKFVSSEITIKKKLTFRSFIKHVIDYISNITVPSKTLEQASIDPNNNLVNSKTLGRLASSGPSNNLLSTGYCSRLASSGDFNKLVSTGSSDNIATAGDHNKLISTGDYNNLVNAGCSGQLISKGHDCKLAGIGDCNTFEVSGENGIIMVAGINCMVKASKGTWISFANFKENLCIGFVSVCVGETDIKPDTWYHIENGIMKEIL